MTEIEDRVRSPYASRALEPDSLFLLRPKDALDMIEAGSDVGLAVLGIEGFIVAARSYQPVQELSVSIGLEDTPTLRRSVAADVRALLTSDLPLDIYFDVVFGEQSTSGES